MQRLKTGRAMPFPFSPAVVSRQQIDQHEAMNEMLLLGLRLMEEGVTNQRFEEQFGLSLQAAFPTEMQALHDKQLADLSPRVYVCRGPRGWSPT